MTNHMPDAIPKLRVHFRHIYTDGHCCGSSCLRMEPFCYYHHSQRVPNPKPRTPRSRRGCFVLPRREDRLAIQVGIGMVLERLAEDSIDPIRAGLLLYGLQIAAANLPNSKPRLN